MKWILLGILIFSPAILAATVSVYLHIYEKKEQQDEKAYLDALTEEEKKEYRLRKHKMLTSQQECQRLNTVNSNNRII